MAIESAADRLTFLDTDDFGTSATIDSVVVSGIFERGYVESGNISGYRPTFLARTDDAKVAAIAVNDTVTISSVAYTCEVIQKDFEGMVLLILKEPD